MKAVRLIALLGACALAFSLVSFAQEGPLNSGSETVARPRNKGEAEKPAEPKIPSKFSPKNKVPENLPTFTANATTVTVDVAVVDNKGHFIPGIPRGDFRVLEDNVPQQIASFTVGEAPMTICMLIEFSNLYQQFYSEPWFQTIQAAYSFVQTLRPDDYVAIAAYDLKPEILSDFTTDRQKTYEALQRLNFAGFSESNLFDAVVDMAERMENIEGRKAILLISSGVDTFSKLNFGETRRRLQDAGVPIYAFGLMQSLRDYYEALGALGPIQELNFLQADNQMRTFATETGGMAFFPHFYGEFPGIFQSISQALRNEYVLSYTPSNQAHDGQFRKIKVELVNSQTNQPLRVVDQKNKIVKYRIIAKPGYKAPRAVE
jgi:Ca-activated chloride channel family protein